MAAPVLRNGATSALDMVNDLVRREGGKGGKGGGSSGLVATNVSSGLSYNSKVLIIIFCVAAGCVSLFVLATCWRVGMFGLCRCSCKGRKKNRDVEQREEVEGGVEQPVRAKQST